MALRQRIVACYLVYNSAKVLERSVRSVRGFADHFVFVDGLVPEIVQFRRCYDDWSSDPALTVASTDGTERICREWGTFIPAPPDAWTTQIAKRNRYLAELREGDWLFVMDPDEVLKAVLPIGLLRRQVFRNQRGAMDLRIVTVQDTKPYDQEGWGTRLIRWREGLHYCRNHATIWGPGDKDVTTGGDKLSASLLNDHRGLKRSEYGRP